ncbi:hypothetical protein [Bythopirellula polymerisocia]|uniref:Uncharacterized protein n=1 Tax=Bythopirellula polymerisocia TaxID=2528003 RepID=A0A5C6CR39_9BACT|nr:hypothetical protein [Bythopirellula polymerisocia]TWU27393.1 hypothetical protein Pla144_21660 [Bythopirellula polymerisocia]
MEVDSKSLKEIEAITLQRLNWLSEDLQKLKRKSIQRRLESKQNIQNINSAVNFISYLDKAEALTLLETLSDLENHFSFLCDTAIEKTEELKNTNSFDEAVLLICDVMAIAGLEPACEYLNGEQHLADMKSKDSRIKGGLGTKKLTTQEHEQWLKDELPLVRGQNMPFHKVARALRNKHNYEVCPKTIRKRAIELKLWENA